MYVLDTNEQSVKDKNLLSALKNFAFDIDQAWDENDRRQHTPLYKRAQNKIKIV